MRYLLCPHLSFFLPYPPLPSPPQEAPSVEVPNSQDAVTLIPADMDSQVESFGEEEKVRAEREEEWEGVGREGNGALIG